MSFITSPGNRSDSVLLRSDSLTVAETEFIATAVAELEAAFKSLSGVRVGVAVLGSARCTEEHPLYQETMLVTRKIADAFTARGVTDFAFITGGGPCVMRAGLEAVRDAATTVGLNIRLPHEEKPNEFQEISLSFSRFMGLRKYAFARYARAFVFMSGGIGTLDEFYEILCLMQVGLIPVMPIYAVGEMYGWLDAVHEKLCATGMISAADRQLYRIVQATDADFADELVTRVLMLPEANTEAKSSN